MENLLVITAVGKDRPGIVDQLSMTILDNGCNINDSRMTVLGGEFAIILLISAKWNALAKLENQLPALGDRLELNITAKRTEESPQNDKLLSYSIDVVSMDHPGIVYQIANFFSSRKINIRELNTNGYAAAHTGTPMFTMAMLINIPADIRIAALREEFLEFCDNLNMDAVLEPSKL
ncbi:MAG: glycine cleavage system protein R [Gammaproteobacteria bacterium]|nr:glycine cleavage system protein R [Gammaproteobacteria bacterium]